VASLDAARNSPRPRSRSALTGEVSPATLLG
jgi:hypothetical protein